MPNKVFISYRRADTADFTVALYNELREHFDESDIFKDVNDIPPGLRFADVLNDALRESAVVLVVIGPKWISQHGERLFDEDDWVRQEIATALAMNLRVVPILANGAKMPARSELPEELHPLRKRQSAKVRNESFEDDVRRLANGVSDVLDIRRPTPVNGNGSATGWDNIFKAVLLLLMLVSIGIIVYAWLVSAAEYKEKVFMSVLGGFGVTGGWAAFTRQRWLELRSNQMTR